MKPETVTRYACVPLDRVIRDIEDGVLPAKPFGDSYDIHPEDVRDYVYYTTGRLRRLQRIPDANVFTAVNLGLTLGRKC